MLFIIFTGALLSSLVHFSITVSANIITVDDDGEADYQTIQEAIDNASTGDTIRVFDGTYNQSIQINTTIHLIGNGSERTRMQDWNSVTIIQVHADNVSISGLNITGTRRWTTALFLSGNHVTISENMIQSHIGIKLNETLNATISSNIFQGSYRELMITGIRGLNTHGNFINSNTFIDCNDGIDFEWNCDRNRIQNNSFFLGGRGVDLGGGGGEYCENNTIVENMFNGTRYGIKSFISKWSVIRENVLHSPKFGIRVSNSDNETMTNNSVIGAEQNAITIQYCENVSVLDNTCHASGIGIYLSLSTSISIQRNTITNNSDAGISLNSVNDNDITHNNISGNVDGLELFCIEWLTMQGNRIHYNSITNSTDHSLLYQGDRIFEIDARYNWWGDATGPHHPTDNPGGTCPPAGESIIVESWLLSEFDYLPHEDRNKGDEDGDEKDDPNFYIYLILIILLIMVSSILITIYIQMVRT